MKKKDYMKPTMHVVKLQHTGMLMGSDGAKAVRSNYETANEQTWD